MVKLRYWDKLLFERNLIISHSWLYESCPIPICNAEMHTSCSARCLSSTSIKDVSITIEKREEVSKEPSTSFSLKFRALPILNVPIKVRAERMHGNTKSRIQRRSHVRNENPVPDVVPNNVW